MTSSSTRPRRLSAARRPRRHSQDAFWELFEPLLFNQQRQSLAKEQVNKIEKLLQIDDSAQILDLCCGNGRHTLELSERGFDVTGVDRTERYIEAARLEAKKRSLNAMFVVDDMRDYRQEAQRLVVVGCK